MSSDTFCWTCARKRPNLKCSNCLRAFHKKCIGEKTIEDPYVCKQCYRQNLYPDLSVDSIPMVIHFILNEPEALPIIGIRFPENIANHVNLNLMAKKDYKSFGELRTDIEWLSHHLRTKELKPKPSDSKSIIKAAIWIVKQFEQEIKNLALCSECYENAYNNPNNSFVMLCAKPHILLWAYCVGWGVWPAKMIKCDVQEDKVNVRFFGDNTDGCVPSSSCYIFTKDPPPGYQHDSTNEDIYNVAMNEVNRYIENIKEKYGNFNFAANVETLDLNKLDELFDFMIGKQKQTRQTDHQNDSDSEPELDYSDQMNVEDGGEIKSSHVDGFTEDGGNDAIPSATVNTCTKNVTPSNERNLLKRPASNDIILDYKSKVKGHLEGIWACYVANDNTNAKLQGEKQTAVEEAARLGAELVIANTQIEQSQASSQNDHLTIIRLENEKRTAVEEVTRLSGELAVANTQIEQSQASFQNDHMTINRLENEKRTAVEEVTRLSGELAVANAQIKQLQASSQNDNITINRLENEKQIAVEEAARLRAELAAEKRMIKNACKVCGKECLMLCGPECLSECLKRNQKDK